MPAPAPDAQLMVPPLWVKPTQVIVPFVAPPMRTSDVPVDCIVNVPEQLMVAPPMLGAVVCPVQFHVKLLNDCV